MLPSWITSNTGPEYDGGKPPPAVILQDHAFDATSSITICPFTSHLVDAPLLRLSIDPSDRDGLRAARQLVIDKVTTVRREAAEARRGSFRAARATGSIVLFSSFLASLGQQRREREPERR